MLIDALQRVVVFLEQRADERPVRIRQERHDAGDRSGFGLGQADGQLPLDRLAALAGGLDGGPLGADGFADAGGFGAAAIGTLLILVEEGEHFAELLQLFAERIDKCLQ